ncbi:MFS transporter [Streptomyces marispadix]|uniref:MHS family MFS transporter n=1 Tax=Streptomyces marispadix TaxID=2922868 RepID=A0ABS9SUZ8_9ACTN|nr:MFS transporter [Streptomyces marispadix]MCH6159876.1 MHS family MFS transporter [Streptomyces marispadix]
MAGTAPSRVPSPGGEAQLRRAVTSSFFGSVIEYYDFLLYATASAVVFSKVFFTGLDPLAGTVASFGTFAAGYLARPLGGIVFGHFGDRLGRKRMLVTTMTLMGTVSFLIGVLPTYEQVGSAAAVLLVLLRVLQGVAVGGEWGGAVLMSAEHAGSRRGLWASFTNAGAPFGMVLSTAALTGTGALVGEDAFLAWGWRIPFLLSIALLAVGLFVRLRVEETPVFAAARAGGGRADRSSDGKSSAGGGRSGGSRVPLLDVLRHHPRNLLLAVAVGLAAFVAQGTLTTFLIAYGVQAYHERQTVLNALTLSSALAVPGIIGWSALSDRVGRRPVVLSGAVAMGVFAFVLFPMTDARNALLLTAALVLGQSVIHPMMYGPLAALYAELFSTRSRYTGASLGYQLAGLGAGLAPLLFAEIRRATGGGGTLSVSLIIAGFCALTVVSVLLLGETRDRELSDAEATGPRPLARS